MRAWLLSWYVVLLCTAPVWAATRVTIPELKDFPERYDGQTIQLECYYDKESPIWVRALPDADEWIGFFVTGKPDKAGTWSGEYYNLLFAPYAMQAVIRDLRGGDKITLIGDVFPYQSMSMEGGGIHVQQVLQGWGPSAKPLGQVSAPAVSTALQPSRVPTPAAAEKYAVTINGKRYEGLRFGDPYNFGGVEFQVDEPRPD